MNKFQVMILDFSDLIHSARKLLCQLFFRSTTRCRGFLPRIGPVNAGSPRRRICGLLRWRALLARVA